MLAPGSGAFLEDSVVEYLGYFYLCIIVIIYRMHTDERGSRCQ